MKGPLCKLHVNLAFEVEIYKAATSFFVTIKYISLLNSEIYYFFWPTSIEKHSEDARAADSAGSADSRARAQLHRRVS